MTDTGGRRGLPTGCAAGLPPAPSQAGCEPVVSAQPRTSVCLHVSVCVCVCLCVVSTAPASQGHCEA